MPQNEGSPRPFLRRHVCYQSAPSVCAIAIAIACPSKQGQPERSPSEVRPIASSGSWPVACTTLARRSPVC
eukprot:10103268-Alexandrium_andersonii.AAC.1